MEKYQVSTKKIVFGVITGILSLVLLLGFSSIVETNNAGYFKVKQAAVTGEMSVKLDPGMFVQLFGTITPFREAGTVWFSALDGEGGRGESVGAVSVRFNDGGTAMVSGNVRYQIPANEVQVINIKKKFITDANLQFQGIQQVVKEAVLLTAALMSSEQAYTARARFSEMARDQIENGIYLTASEVVVEKDPLTGEVMETQIVRIKYDKDTNLPLRKPNPLAVYGIQFSQAIIKDINYEEGTKKLIATKREYLMLVTAKRAEAENAIQERKTAEEVGKKNVMETRYAALVVKEAATIKANQDKVVAETLAAKTLEVAKYDKLAAEQEKAAAILRGQGEGEYKRLVLQADGALAQKLATFERVNEHWSKAYSMRAVPTWSMGAGGAGAPGSDTDASNFQAMLSLMITKQLGLDLTIPSGTSTK